MPNSLLDGAASDLRIQRHNTTLRQQVVDVLRNAILECRFRPGDRLVERELCALTGVSRTSVREALRHLESEGLVTNIPNRGPTVADVTLEEAEQIYEVREALEGLVSRLFALRATDDQIAQLQAALVRLEEAFDRGETSEILAETKDFYDIFLEGSCNTVIGNMIRSLNARIVFLRATSMSQPGRGLHSLREIQKIVDAIARRDAAGAQAAAEDHVRQARNAAMDVLHERQRRAAAL